MASKLFDFDYINCFPEPMLLPASCDVFNNSGGGEQCQCTCSPGFTGAPNTFAGTTCEYTGYIRGETSCHNVIYTSLCMHASTGEAINITNEKENVNTSSPEIMVTSTPSMLEVSTTPTISTILSSGKQHSLECN